jgi:hypothetical protein
VLEDLHRPSMLAPLLTERAGDLLSGRELFREPDLSRRDVAGA